MSLRGAHTRKGYAASVTLVPRERLRSHGASALAMTWEGSLYAVGSSCTGGDMSPPYREASAYGLLQGVGEGGEGGDV